jgi:iron complex transport system substrate-binding protein
MRIASLSPSITEILFALGLEHTVVCVDTESDEPVRVSNLPHISLGIEELDAELSEFQPEIILTSLPEREEVAEQLRLAGFHVVHFDPHSLEEVYECIHDIGMLFEREREAAALIRAMREAVNTVKKRVRTLPGRCTIFVGRTAEQSSLPGWVPDIIRVAGGEMVQCAAETSNGSPDPDLVFLCAPPGDSTAALHLFRSDVERRSWTAIRENRLYTMEDALLNRHGPRLPESAQRMFARIFEYLHS